MQESLRISLIQTKLYLTREENLYHFDKLICKIENTDIILLPEMFNTSFLPNQIQLAEHMEGDTVKWMYKKSKEHNCSIAGSLMIKEKNKVFNRLVWITDKQEIITYDKKHLFPLVCEEQYINAGKKRVIIQEKGWKIFPQICYDLRFPVFSRNDMNYDILIYLANWPESRTEIWETLLKARAIENQCYAIGVNRIGKDSNNINFSGDSMVLNFNGEILNKISANNQKVQTVILKKQDLIAARIKYPFLKDRDLFILKN